MTSQDQLRVLIDARATMGGIARYTHELGRLMKTCSHQNQVFLYGQGKTDRFRSISSRHGLRRFLRHALGGYKRILTDQLLLPLAAHRTRVDLLHSTNYFVPLWAPTPVVVNCYDLSLLHYFTSKKAGLMKYYERFILLNGLHRAAHVIAPCNAVASELKQRFGFPEHKVSFIYPPLPSFCFAVPSQEQVLDQRIPQQPFFLSVGTIEPRKNISRLLQGWRGAYSQCRIPLLLVGPYGWRQRRLLEEQLAASDGLYWLDDIDDATLSALYRKATAVIQYSLEEGFDYPVAEGLCLGTPVVASDIAVHREVMAGCGLLAPANDPEALTARLLEVCSWSAQQLADFRLKARQQADLFKQHSTVDRYIFLYRRILAKKNIAPDS